MEKKELAWQTDASGIVRGAKTHDGCLVGLSLVQDTLSFYVKRIDGSVVLFELVGTDDVKLDILKNAILSEIYVWKASSVPEISVSPPDSGWNALYGGHSNDMRGKIEKLTKLRPELFLISVSCSYGGGLAAICSEIHICEMVEAGKA